MKTSQFYFPVLSQLYLPMLDKSKYLNQMKEINIFRYKAGSVQECTDFAAVESPLQINILGKAMSVTMRTPGDDIALALGFLFSEGLISDYNAIADCVQIDDNTVNILPEDENSLPITNLERNFYATSSCGVCGKTSVDTIAALSRYVPPTKEIHVSTDTLTGLQEKLLSVQATFEVTGGLHACALFSPEGKYLYHSEDVGRHNAVDKLIGHAIMADILPLDEHIFLIRWRAGCELVQKASMAGIPLIAAVGAPSSLAIDLAIANGLSLVGFLKKTSFNIYCGKHRVE